MSPRLRALAVLPVLTLAACGDGASTIAPDAGGAVASDASLEGPPEIVSLSVDRERPTWRETVHLTWAVKNATLVEITTPSGTLVSTFANEGTAESSPIVDLTTKFVLTAHGVGPSATREVEVTLDLDPPRIDAVTVDLLQGVVDSPISVSYSVFDASRVHLKLDGVEVADRAAEIGATSMGIFSILPRAEDGVLEVVAENAAGSVRVERTFHVDRLPTIQRFVVRPSVAYTDQRTVVVEWAVTGAQYILLQSDAPTPRVLETATGSTTVDLFRRDVSIGLTASKGNARVSVSRYTGAPTLEREPNGNLENSNGIGQPGGAIGGIAPPDDLDVFTYQPEYPGRFRITTRSSTGIGCTTDTWLRITDFAGLLLGLDHDGGEPILGGTGACATVEIELGEPGGPPLPFAIEVRGERNATGDYALEVDDL